MNPAPALHLRLFGSPGIEGSGGAPLTGRVAQRHRLALLALLALAPGGRLSRDKLTGYLWPESNQDRARNLLRVAMYVIRSSLGDDALLAGGDELRLNAEVLRSDVAEFEAAIARGDHAAALSLYRGPFLDGFFLGDAPDFEQWASAARERLAGGYRGALETLAESAERAGNYSVAAERWKTRAAQDPFDSRVAGRLMQALDASGNRAAALQHADMHQRLLQQEYGIASAPEIAALAERLRTRPASPAPATETRGVATPAQVAPATETRGVATLAQVGPTTREPTAEPQPATAGGPSAPARVSHGGTATPPRRRWNGRWTGVAALAGLVLVVSAVWRFSPGSADRDRSIAVLPFADLSPSGDNEYFSDGLTEEIITGLSGVPELRVISRTSAMHYKRSGKPLRQIAQELNVAHILEGSVRQSGGRVRISAQLIDARTDEHLWANSYDDDLRDILRVQEEIARHVVRALEVRLAESGALVRRGTRDPEAYQLYTRARFLWNTRTREGHDLAIEYFSRAIARDSGYADAYAGLSDAYSTAYQLNVSSLPAAELYSRSKWAVERATALDEKSADAHTSLGTFLLWQKNWPGAERALRRAIRLNSSHATAHSWYSLLLSGMGRAREALEESARANALDPFAVIVSSNYGWQCYLARDYDCAIEQYLRTAEIGPSHPRAYDRLGLAYARKGMLDDAERAVRQAIDLAPERPDFLGDLAFVQALRGETAAARETLTRAKAQPIEPFTIARAHAALHEPDSAFAWLERSSWQWPHRADRRDPALDALRSDPRFARLSERIEREMGMR